MEIIKRNLTSIICGAVALLSVVAVTLWPIPGWYTSITEKLQASKNDYDTLQSLNNEKFTKPIVDPAKTEGDDLGQFPNQKAIEAGLALAKVMQDQAAAVAKITADMNKHEPLVPDALPVKKTGYAYNTFKIAYYEQLKRLAMAMRAMPAPTTAEIEAQSRKLQEEFDKQKTRVGGVEVGGAGLDEMLVRRLASLPDEMRRTRAKEAAVFIASQDIMDTCRSQMPTPDSADLPSIEQIWAAQVSLWIQEDVVRAIALTNGPDTVVENSIIKRLVRWDIPKEYVNKSGRASILSGSNGAVADPTAAEASPNAKAYDVSVTGRVSNPLYDVMHFTLVVDADALQFRKFMANLVKDRFITILRADIIGVDRERELARGYTYGPNPVIRLALRCEVIFFRSWTKPLMPQPIKQLVGIPSEEKPAQDAAAPVAEAQ
ncbi:MAG: hypothetical protein ACM359_23225 [Bacillota bacterium]